MYTQICTCSKNFQGYIPACVPTYVHTYVQYVRISAINSLLFECLEILFLWNCNPESLFLELHSVSSLTDSELNTRYICTVELCVHNILVNMKAANGPFNAPSIPSCSDNMEF